MMSAWVIFIVPLFCGLAVGAPSPDCTPAAVQEQPPSVRNFCAALYQLSNAYEALIEDNMPIYPAGGLLVGEGSQKGYRGTVKRQDVEHVFLRFGRRR